MIDYTSRGPITTEETSAGLFEGSLTHGFPVLDVRRYGADPTGVNDSTSAIQTAINVCNQTTSLDSSAPVFTWITSLQGGAVYFPRGVYKISNTITLKNRVSLVGDSYTASCIAASSGMTDAVMIDCVDGTDPIFDSRIERLRVHASNNDNITQVITAQAWQEHCGLFNCSIDGFRSEGILITDVSSGAAGFSIEHTTFGGFTSCTAAIHVESSVPNSFTLNVREVTINPSGAATNGIDFENGRLLVDGLHVETCTNGIIMNGGNAVINFLTGASDVTSCINIASGFGGSVEYFHIDPNGGTRAVDDNVTSRDITQYIPKGRYPVRPQFTSGDTTPSVASQSPVYRTFNSSATTITDWDFNTPGQEFFLRFQDANTTISIDNNANIVNLTGASADLTPATGDFLRAQDDGGTWYVQFFDATP